MAQRDLSTLCGEMLSVISSKALASKITFELAPLFHEFLGTVNFDDQSFLEKVFWDTKTKKFNGDIQPHLKDLENRIQAELTKFERAGKRAVRYFFLRLVLFFFRLTILRRAALRKCT